MRAGSEHARRLRSLYCVVARRTLEKCAQPQSEMDDLARSVLTHVRAGDGPGPLLLARMGNDTKHPEWSPHNNHTYIPIFAAYCERVNAEVVYTIAVIDTHSEAHLIRREHYQQPVWEVFRYHDLEGAAAFAFGFLVQRAGNRNDVSLQMLRAGAKDKLIGAENVLPVGMESIYSTGSSLARMDVTDAESMEKALKSLNASLK